MSYPSRVLFRSLVQPFYKENLNLFFFAATILFFAVGEVDGAELFQFHESLALGMLQSGGYILFVFFIWGLYLRKCIGFVVGRLKRPEYGFVMIYSRLASRQRFFLFLRVVLWLMMPVLGYVVFLAIISIYRGWYSPILLVVGYLLLVCVVAALWLLKGWGLAFRIGVRWPLSSVYPMMLLRSIAHRQKLIWLGLKLFTCGVLFLTALNNGLGYYETTTLFLFFNFGIFANGMLVHGLREFEEGYLHFYRGLPVPLPKRLAEYCLVYFVLLLPEIVTAGVLTPVHLHYGDAVVFVLNALGLVLLMNGISFLRHFGRREYGIVLLMIFSVQYIFMGFIGLIPLCVVVFVAAIVSFLAGYYRFERN